MLHGLTNDGVPDRGDNNDDLSDSASDTERSNDGDSWSMTSREEATLSSFKNVFDDPLLPINSKYTKLVDVAV
eukprot:10117491-Karenia_brevis.AAC.1